MRVLLSTYGSRGDVEPLVASAVQLQVLGADVRMCAPPDEEFTELLAREGVSTVTFDRPWRSWKRPPTAEERQQRVADFIATLAVYVVGSITQAVVVLIGVAGNVAGNAEEVDASALGYVFGFLLAATGLASLRPHTLAGQG